MDIIKKTDISFGEDMEKLELSHTTEWECKMVQPLWKQSGTSSKGQNYHTTQQFHWHVETEDELK